jgi:tetratricopeptide (TPR) repeat protein
MCRVSFQTRLALAIALLCSSAATALPADDVARYLEERGLTQLLVLHLEESLRSAAEEERPALAARLAELYAELLETTTDVSLRVDLESRSRELLALVPEESADELRLALLQGSYSSAERTAEDHRLRLGDEEGIARAQAILVEVIPQFAAVRDSIQSRIEVAERRRGRARGAETARLNEEVEKLSDLRAKAAFLLAWAQYYRAWLAGNADEARVAEGFFADVIDPEVRRLTPEEVSRDLLATEAFARAVLGMGLTKSITSGADVALRWIDLLNQEETAESVRAQAPAWRIAVMLEHGDFRAARNILDAAARDGADGPPLAWVRLAAAHALEQASANSEAADLARSLIAQLAARGELQQVLDLAQRYGVEWMGERGFASLYVRGVQTYQLARDGHGSEDPTTDSELQGLYQQAAALFNDATGQPDAAQFSEAAAGARSLIGWCHYFSGRFFDAQRAFEESADELPPGEAEEALWMAIVSLDRVVNQASSDEQRAQLNGLIRAFLERYPSSEHAPRLVLRQSEEGAAPSLELVQELLNVPANSENHAVAQRRAADMLYDLFRAAAGDRRVEIGERFLNVELTRWLGDDETALAAGEDAAREAHLIRARRILEVALYPDIARAGAAEQTLARLDTLEDSNVLDLAGVIDELDFRRFQIHMLEGDRPGAEAMSDALWERQAGSPWAAAAAHALFKQAAETWRGARDPAPDVVERVVRFGGRALSDLEDSGRSLNEPAVLTAFATVAEAATWLWENESDREQGERAFVLYDHLLSAHPNNATFLRAIGLLAPEFGEPQQALAAWRKLVAGTPAGSEQWLEAKYHLIAMLAETDPAHARSVMDQHKALYPDYGPPPWAARMRALDSSIPAHPGSTPIDDDDGAGDGAP